LGEHEIFFSLAVAAASGLLVGLERERSAGDDRGRSTFPGGARTHPLVALSGALATLLSRSVGPAAVVVAFGAIVAFLALGYARDLRSGGERGMTSEVAFVVTFLLGAASTATSIAPPERRFLAIAATAVVVTLLLSAKPVLRPFARRMSEDDVVAALKFLVLSVVVLPLLPDAALGPFGALNPFKIGVLVVLVAAVDFVGYVAIRLLGANRGLGLTGFVGGLASSTAVTLSMSARAREEPAATTGCLLAILLAGSVMFLRALGLVAVAGPHLLGVVVRPIGAMAVVGFALCAVVYARGRRSRERGELELSNPFELASALKFGAFFALVLVGSKAAAKYFGAGGTYAAAFLAGVADVDAITLSMAGAAGGPMPDSVAAIAIFVATASNTLFKAGMAVVVGGWRFGRWVALAFGLTVVAGLAGASLLWRG
jgi:uncharacterized membrane protein (DUF4010 family)